MKKFIGVGAAVVLLAAFIGCAALAYRQFNIPDGIGKVLRYIRPYHKPDPYFDKVYGYGIDLSHHNAEPHWETLQVDFIFLKASEGASYVDPTFSHRASMSRHHNIPVGAYHFFSGTGDAENEFENFSRQIKGKIDIIPVIDVERKPKNVSRKTFQQRFVTFISEVKREYGVYPIIYTSEGFYYSYLKRPVEAKFKGTTEMPVLWFGDVGLQYVNYRLTPHIHQSAIKNIPGINGKIDFNELHCELDSILLSKI